MHRMKLNVIAFIVIILLFVGGLLWWSARVATPQAETMWPGTDIACLPNGHANVARHIHPTLKMFVQGQEIPIRANIGVSETCMAEIHTHDTSGAIHIETTDTETTHTIGDLFAILGEEMEREGFTLTATLNGEVIDNIASHPLQEDDEVVLSYEVTETVDGE